MVRAILILLFCTQAQAAADKDINECEEQLEGIHAMRRLQKSLFDRSGADLVRYRIFMRADKITAEFLRALREKELWVENFGVSFQFEEVYVYPMTSELVAAFKISGPPLNVIQAIQQLIRPEVQEWFELEPYNYSEASAMLPAVIEAVARRQGTLGTVGISRALKLKVEQLHLAHTTEDALISRNVVYIGDLVKNTERDLTKVFKFDDEAMKEVRGRLGFYNLKLGMTLSGVVP